MPDQGLQFPYLNPTPDNVSGFLDLQRKQQLASMLMGAAQQNASTPPEWNSMRVVPKRSPLSNVASLATALMAGKTMHDLPKAQADYYQGLMGGSAPAQSAQAPPVAAPQGASQGAPNAPPPAASGLAQPPAQPQSNPMLLTGEPRTSQMLFQMMGQQEYAKALAGKYAPTDMEKMLTAAHIDPASAEGQQALRANIAKSNYIAPLEEREGSVERDPRTNAVIGVNPKTDTGGVNLYDSQGRYSGQSLAPGAAEAIRGSEQAAALGKTQGQFNILPNAGGGSTVIPPGGAIPGGAPQGAQAPRVAPPAGARPAPTPLPGAWGSMPRLPVSPSLGAPDAFTEGRLKAAGSKDAELSSQYGKEADLADQKLQYNVESLKALPAAETGPLSEWMTENRAKLLELGVPESVVPGSGQVTPTMELNKNLKQSALQGARAIFGSRMTQMEVRLQHEELSPSTSMTRDAIQSLMQQDTIKQQYAKQRSQDYGKYVQNGGDPLRFESWYSKTFPLTTFAAKAVTPAEAVARVQKNPALVPDFKAKYGWDPNAQ